LTLASNQQVRKKPRQNTAGLFHFQTHGISAMTDIVRSTKIECKKHKKPKNQRGIWHAAQAADGRSNDLPSDGLTRYK
jgi:hypothetical protein